MAVFPDRIVLKNSTDDEAAIIAAIESGGTDEITQGEAVLGLLEGEAVIYTKDSLGDIVTINGNAQTLDKVGDVVYPQIAPGWDKKQGFFWNCQEPEGTYNAVSFEGIDRINLHTEDKDGNNLADWLGTWTTSDIYSVFLNGVQVGSSGDLTYLQYSEGNCWISVAFADTTIWSAVDNAFAGSTLQVQNNSRPFTVKGEPADGSILVYNSAAGVWEAQPNTGGGGDDVILPTVVDSTIDSDSSPDTSLTLASPSSTSGDLLVACIMSRQDGGALTPPAGFTLYGEYLSSILFSGNGQTISVFTKTAASSEPASYTWTQASSSRICGWVASVNGTDGIDSVDEAYGNALTAAITLDGNALTLTAATWVYANATSEEYSQLGPEVIQITDSPNGNARVSGGYKRAQNSFTTLVTSTHSGTTTDNSPNHGMIAIKMLTPSSGGGGGGTGGLVFWGGGDFTTGDSDGEAPDGGEFTV